MPGLIGFPHADIVQLGVAAQCTLGMCVGGSFYASLFAVSRPTSAAAAPPPRRKRPAVLFVGDDLAALAAALAHQDARVTAACSGLRRIDPETMAAAAGAAAPDSGPGGASAAAQQDDGYALGRRHVGAHDCVVTIGERAAARLPDEWARVSRVWLLEDDLPLQLGEALAGAGTGPSASGCDHVGVAASVARFARAAPELQGRVWALLDEVAGSPV